MLELLCTLLVLIASILNGEEGLRVCPCSQYLFYSAHRVIELTLVKCLSEIALRLRLIHKASDLREGVTSLLDRVVFVRRLNFLPSDSAVGLKDLSGVRLIGVLWLLLVSDELSMAELAE